MRIRQTFPFVSVLLFAFMINANPVFGQQKAAVVKIIYPSFYQNLPDTLLMGDFSLIVEKYTNKGSWSFKDRQAMGLAGPARRRRQSL